MWLLDTCKKNKPLLCFDRYVDSSHCRGDVAHDIGPGVAAVRRDRRPLHGRLSTPQTVSFSIPTIFYDVRVIYYAFFFKFFLLFYFWKSHIVLSSRAGYDNIMTVVVEQVHTHCYTRCVARYKYEVYEQRGLFLSFLLFTTVSARFINIIVEQK